MNSTEKELVKKFWDQFIPYKIDGYENIYNTKKSPVKPGIEQRINSLGVYPSMSIVVNLNKNSTNIALVIYEKGRSKEENSRIFNHIKHNSHSIQEEFSNKIVWEDKPDNLRKIARITNDKLKYTKQSDWIEINDWSIKNSYLLKKLSEEALRSYHD